MSERKRGARGAGSIRQRKDGRWEARFVVGVDPGTGKDIRKSIYAATQREARKKMTEALAAVDRNDYRDPCKMSVGQWLDIWTAEYLGNVKPSTAYLYQERIRQAVQYLKTGSQDSVRRMQDEMQKASENLEFEKAALLRDRIRAIEKASDSQKILDNEFRNADIIALADNQDRICISVLIYRNGRLSDKINYEITEQAEESVLDAFVFRFYQDRNDFPEKILLERELSEMELAGKLLSGQAGHKIKLYVPKKGGGLELLKMAKQNAVEAIAIQENRTGKELLALEALGKMLGLKKIPKYIESYDISNLASESMVAGMIVFENLRERQAFEKSLQAVQHQGTAESE